MKPHMSLDQFGRSSIRNLYYDTDTYLLVRRSIEKPTYKEKIRIRSYGQATAESPVFVELKKNIDNYSLEDLEKECALAFAECVKKFGSFSLNNKAERKPNFVSFAATTSNEEGSNAFLDGLRDIGRNKK